MFIIKFKLYLLFEIIVFLYSKYTIKKEGNILI